MWIFPVDAEELAHPKKCKTCGQPIIWAKTQAGSAAPLNSGFKVLKTLYIGDGTRLQLLGPYASHFSTCPQANQHRKRRK